MMWALSRRLLPGSPYTPSAVGGSDAAEGDTQREKWRLEECLRYVAISEDWSICLIMIFSSGRFATELAGRKARRKGWAGLADEMAAAGWFEL